MSLKVFQIGFNKSGTVSIYNFFQKNGFNGIHWDRGRLSKQVSKNINLGIPPLVGYEEYDFFSDMEHHLPSGGFEYSYEYFKELDKAYENAIFILNYRAMKPWIRSRIKHGSYLFNSMRKNNMSRESTIDSWENHYKQHIANCKKYFEGKNNFLLLDMESEKKSEILTSFLKERGIELETDEIPHAHKSSNKKSNSFDDQTNAVFRAAISLEQKSIEDSLSLMEILKKYDDQDVYAIKVSQYREYLERNKD